MIATFMIGLTATSALAADKNDNLLSAANKHESASLDAWNTPASVEVVRLSEKSGTLKSKPGKDKDFNANYYMPGWKECTDGVIVKNIYGETLFRFWTKIYWEWDTTKITKVNRTCWGEVDKQPWQFTGYDKQGYYYNSNASYYSYCTGTFKFIVAGQVLNTTTCWIQQRVHAGGGYSFTGGF